MARRDGEQWLEGRPFGEEKKAQPTWRDTFLSRRWWLTFVVVALLVGIGWEGAAAALGDGDFSLRVGLRDSAGVAVAGFLATLLFSRRA